MYDIKKLKQLREKTGVSFSLCKKALEETNNDLTEAKKLLQKWGEEKGGKTQLSRKEGAIFSYLHHNKKIAVLVEINCQTDFVANNNEFQHLGQEIAMQIASMNPETVEELLNQESIRDPSKKVSDFINEATLKFGENIKISRFIRWVLGKN